MPWEDAPLRTITIPGDAGPGDARIVITSELPPPLDTYTFNGAQTYSGGIIYYAAGGDTNYTYLCVVNDPAGDISVHIGHVRLGVVVDDGLAHPFVQSWLLSPATGQQVFEIAARDQVRLSTGPTGGNLLLQAKKGNISLLGTGATSAISGSTSGTGDITFDAGGVARIGRNAGTVAWQVSGTNVLGIGDNATIRGNTAILLTDNIGPETIDINSTGIRLATAAAGSDITLSAADDVFITATGQVISLDANGGAVNVAGDLNVTGAGNVYQMDATQVRVLTSDAYAQASGAISPNGTITLIPGCSVNVTSLRANAVCKIRSTLDFQELASSTSTSVVFIYVDGVQQSPQAIFSGRTEVGLRGTYAQNFRTTLAAAGAHTIELRCQNTLSSTAHQIAAQHTTIDVEVFE